MLGALGSSDQILSNTATVLNPSSPLTGGSRSCSAA